MASQKDRILYYVKYKRLTDKYAVFRYFQSFFGKQTIAPQTVDRRLRELAAGGKVRHPEILGQPELDKYEYVGGDQ